LSRVEKWMKKLDRWNYALLKYAFKGPIGRVFVFELFVCLCASIDSMLRKNYGGGAVKASFVAFPTR
jgi:hypothetical protein